MGWGEGDQAGNLEQEDTSLAGTTNKSRQGNDSEMKSGL
jgi:hypothetical protein